MTQTQLSQDFSLGVRSHCRSRLPPRITLKAAMKSHHGFFFLFSAANKKTFGLQRF